MAVQFTAIVDFMIIMPLGPYLEQAIGVTTDKFTWVVTAYTYAAAISGFCSTLFLDRFARRPAFLALFAGFIVGTLMCGLVTDFPTLVAARVLTGAFGGLLGGMSLTIVGDIFPEERRGEATGTLMMGFALASSFGVPLGLFLGDRYGWHAPFLVLAALCVPFMGLAAAILPRMDGHLARYDFGQSPLDRLRVTYGTPNHLRAFALMTALMLGGFSVIPFMNNYLVRNVGIVKELLVWPYVAGGLTALVGMRIIGRLADRYGKLRVFRVMIPLNAAILLAITCLPHVSLAVVMFAVSMTMLFNGGRMVPAMAMIVSSVEPRLRGGFMGANSAVQHLAAGLGTTIGGMIIFQPQPGAPISRYPYVGLFAAAVTLSTLWLAGRLRPAQVAAASPGGNLAVPTPHNARDLPAREFAENVVG